MMNCPQRLLAVALVSGFMALVLGNAQADEEQWKLHHPRRAEVNKRLAIQHQRIHHDVKAGEMTHEQAAALYKEDHQIRQQEREMASQHGGHITKQEQATLNQQEHAVSQQIRQQSE